MVGKIPVALSALEPVAAAAIVITTAKELPAVQGRAAPLFIQAAAAAAKKLLAGVFGLTARVLVASSTSAMTLSLPVAPVGIQRATVKELKIVFGPATLAPAQGPAATVPAHTAT